MSNHNLPVFEIAEGPNEVTLTTKDFGRSCVVHDVGKLFDTENLADPSEDAWKGVVQVVLSVWGVVEAGAIHPDQLNAWTTCSKETLTALRSWTFIRATGRHPPEGETPGQAASASDKEWAAKPFEDF